MIVLDQVTALFKDQLINTNCAGMSSFHLKWNSKAGLNGRSSSYDGGYGGSR